MLTQRSLVGAKFALVLVSHGDAMRLNGRAAHYNL